MKTKTKLLALCAGFLTTANTVAQNPELAWVKQMGGTDREFGASVATDNAGNVYSTGYFKGTIDFDPGIGVTDLTSFGNYDIYIQKLDASGNLIWVKQIGSTGDDQVASIAVNAEGDVFTIGNFQSTVDFDPGIGVTNLASNGSNDTYILKLDANGNFQWVNQIGGISDESGVSITLDTNGYVYASGVFMETVDFDPGVGTTNLTSLGGSDGFVQKLNANGTLEWVKQIGGASDIQCYEVSVDLNGNTYVSGNFQGTVDFDPGAGITNLISNGSSDIFIQKLDASGEFQWVNQMGGSGYETAFSITNDANGNVYTTGYFQGMVDFDPSAASFELTSLGGDDVFIQKLNTNGEFLWVKQMGGASNSDRGISITTDVNNNVYTIGSFRGSSDFDPGIDSTILVSNGNTDIFIQKLDGDGDFLWAKHMGATFNDAGNSIAVDANSNLYTTGAFRETVDFDLEAGVTNITSNGDYDIFIQKLSQCQTSFGTDIQTACESYTWIDGNIYTSSNDSATFIINNAAGCDSVVTLNLTINAVSDLSTSVNGVTITSNNANATYQWIDCTNGNTPIANETNQSFTASANGEYSVEITENGCSDTSECVLINSVGINNYAVNETFIVYPNPTSGEVNIVFENAVSEAQISVFSFDGKLIMQSIEKEAKTANLSIKNQPAGVYFIDITTENEMQTVRMLKQ